MTINVKVKRLYPDVDLPTKAHSADACFDLCAESDFVVYAGGRSAIPTGLSLAVPPGYKAQIYSRSGLALRNGLVVIGGVVDSGYSGEVKVILLNTTEDDYHGERGDKIAQFAIEPVLDVEFAEVESLDETERGSGGFGSTGK